MNKRLNCVMLIDDNKDDNFFHERVIRKSSIVNKVISKESGPEALAYLMEEKDDDRMHPDLIFLDINMPGMNGWEFLDEYDKLDEKKQGKVVVVMLTTSNNPDDKAKAEVKGHSDFKTKPLTVEMLYEIVEKYF